MPRRDIIAIGASLGGVEALTQLAGQLPAGLAAALLIVCHLDEQRPSFLAHILNRAGPLPATTAADGAAIEPGHIYVAPPDHHLLVESGGLRLSRGPRENRFRPSIDVLFRSAARHYGPRLAAVVLTGGLYDGVAGLLAVRGNGGLAIVQDPATALDPTLPENALAIAGADAVVPLAELGPHLVGLTGQAIASGVATMNDPMDELTSTTAADRRAQEENGRRGEPSVYGCPACGGVLWQVDETDLVRFRCHIGHSYVANELLAEQNDALEAALWTAVRTFRDRATLSRQLAQREAAGGNSAAQQRFAEQADQADEYAELIQRCVIERGSRPGPPAAASPS